MSSTTFESGPLLVSDLPPVAQVAGLRELVQTRLATARDRRSLHRALRLAGPAERSDLLAQLRRG